MWRVECKFYGRNLQQDLDKIMDRQVFHYIHRLKNGVAFRRAGLLRRQVELWIDRFAIKTNFKVQHIAIDPT